MFEQLLLNHEASIITIIWKEENKTAYGYSNTCPFAPPEFDVKVPLKEVQNACKKYGIELSIE
jgi:hypothetical protein